MVDEKPAQLPDTRLLELDALRGVAIILVIFFHFTTVQAQVKHVFRFGVTGVELFFIISGFVIFLTLEKTQKWQDFAVARFSRLYPAYWTCVTITAGLVFLHEHRNILAQYLGNLTMFQHMFDVADLDVPYWTMLLEMQFYLLMLLFFQLRLLKWIEAAGGTVLLACLVYSTAPKTGPYDFFFYYLPLLSHFPMFFAGILFYKIKFHQPTFLRWALIAACLAVQASLHDDGPIDNAAYMTVAEYAVILTIYAAMFVLYVRNQLGFIANKVLLFVGTISYPLYLLHQYMGRTVVIPFAMEQFHLDFWVAAVAAGAPSVIIAATLVTYLVEKPAMRFIRRKYSGPAPATL